MAVKVGNTHIEVSGPPQDIVGTSYSEILPTQPSVNKGVVESKLGMGTLGTKGMTAWISPHDKIYLLDGHHTFVATRQSGRTAEIKIKKFGFPAGNYNSWSDVSYADFTPAKEKLKR